MPLNPPENTNPVSEERSKLAWFRLRDDGQYDVVMYYPKTDKFKYYVGQWALHLTGDGEIIDAEDMTGRLIKDAKERVWSLANLLYFWRQE